MAGNWSHALVSPAEALLSPYPYVHVNVDGTARELHPKEREYLETPFEPGDGGRPYVKFNFEQKDGWGSISGFCLRSEIPIDRAIAPAPAIDPNPLMNREEYIEQLKSQMVGFDVVEKPDGTVSMRRRVNKAD